MNTSSGDLGQKILGVYVRAPDTPDRPSDADRELAKASLQRGTDAENLVHAIKVASIRRQLRDPPWPPLPPVRSLAYYLRVLEDLDQQALEPGYVDYVAARFDALIAAEGQPETESAASRPQCGAS